MPKTTLPCQYRTGKTVSSGAHAIVKEAIHIKTRKYYACKIVVKDDLPGSAHLVGNEISILKRVRSENINIVRLHDYFQTAHSIYLCLDLCTGGTLWDRITTQGVYNETKVIGIVRTLFLAVKHIHEAGVVHRDLRPENLFFRTPAADAPIMIFDFQHSRIVEDTPNPETDVDLRNTPRYMAPEILLEKFHDKPVDVWALGSIAFFVTTGSTPFDGDEPEQVAQAVVTGNIPEEKWDTVSINAREFISLCLSIEPAQRPTVEEALAYTWLVPATPHFLLKSSRMSSTSRVSSMRDLRLPRFFNPRRKWRILGHAVKALVLLHTLVKRHRPSAQSDTEDSTDQDFPYIYRHVDLSAYPEQQAAEFPSPVSSVFSFSDQESLTRGSMFTATEDTELSTRDSDNASCRESAIEFPAHHSRQRESLSTSQETTNFPSTTSSEYKNVQRINTPESTGSSLAATDVPISTFVIYTPDKTTHDRPAVTPEDIKSIENNFTEGGIVLSAHHSTEAEAWVEDHYDDQVFASARSAGLRGPIAVMLSPDVPALAIFGSILDESVLSMGETLADISGFAVMVRPIDDDPVPKFPEPDGSDEPGVTVYTMGPGSKGDEEDNENHDGDQDDKLSDGMRLGDETVAEGRVWRLRGGRGDESDQEDDEIPWFSKAHRAGVWVKLWPDKKRPYDLGLRTTTMFKLQSQYSEEKKMGVQPEVIGHLTLKVETPAKILPDRSYTSLGFLAHRQDSIIERDFIDCGFDQPDQTRKSIDQQSKGATATFNAGYMNLHPTVSAGATYSETRTRTVELADNKPTPRCRIFHDPGQRWNEDGKSYTSYDITTVPGKNPTNGQQHDLEAEYAMGINLLPVENAGLPKISFITRNQVVIWISDPTLKAKVRGLLVLMTTYIPNIRTRKALIVQEELNYHFATSNSPENAPPPPPSAVDAMAVSLSMAPIETQRSRRKSISALFTDVRRKWSANKERTLDLPLQEYISRGWDATNETWRSAVWTSLLDKDFRNTELDKASTSPAWKLRFQPSAKIPEDADLEEVGNDVALDINAGNEPAEVYVVEEVGVAI